MLFEEIAQAAGYVSLAILALIIVANVVIIFAQFVHNKRLAQHIAVKLAPVAWLFRLGEVPKGHINHNQA